MALGHPAIRPILSPTLYRFLLPTHKTRILRTEKGAKRLIKTAET